MRFVVICIAASLAASTLAFAPRGPRQPGVTCLHLHKASLAAPSALHSQLANIMSATTTASILLGQPEYAAAADSVSAIPVARTVIDVFVNTLSLLFLCRTVLSWYPKTDLNQFPYSIAAWPTEPLLLPVRSLIPPAFGVDVSSIVWVMLLSFLREILTGQQGILTLLEKNV